MGHTNSTANLSLPQFIGTDKPTWLGDVNGAFLAIDGYAGTNDAAVAAAASDASSALSQASAAVNTANTANTTAGNASTTANNAIGVANTANAIAGTVDAKVGLLADLHTSNRTSIVNAINELADGSSISVTADGVKTTSQILDELYALIDSAKITDKTVLNAGGQIFVNSGYILNTSYSFSRSGVSATFYLNAYINVRSSGSDHFSASTNNAGNVTITDISSTVIPAGTVFKLTY